MSKSTNPTKDRFYLKSYFDPTIRVSKFSHVYISAVMEYLLMELIEISVSHLNQVDSEIPTERKEITETVMVESIINDPEIALLFRDSIQRLDSEEGCVEVPTLNGDDLSEAVEGDDEGVVENVAPEKSQVSLKGDVKKPRTGYNFFQMDQRPLVKEENPDMSNGDIQKEIAKRWREIDPETKELYLSRGEEDKARYKEELNSV
eukprot:TRINITY_DN12063_c0_g1_i1.p1 TRINITY_DN12063_c0_g1~~TRINITY_DN12063_c0_g1_i1.p1  ORF type:complete len:204 (-),score=48.81 TRINITY_DN12063_c0_g1_i1:40-651(-)